jgi:5,10-methylene-tetrahydrofolate dehydrogenase/methenyl tetrahydrofolate cyclohydrolase
MVSLPFFTHLRMQNICQTVQPSDNYNEFIELEDFDHKTMKKGCQENHPKKGILLLLKRKKLHTPREEGAVWSADRFRD